MFIALIFSGFGPQTINNSKVLQIYNLTIILLQYLVPHLNIVAGGRNVEFQNVDRPKISERRNGLFSWSEHRNQTVKNVFWVDQNSNDQNLEKNIENQKLDFRRSDFTYGFKTDQNVENRNINYLWRITYGYQGLWGVGLGSIRLG